MKTFRYLEFMEKTDHAIDKDGKLWLVGDYTAELIEELNLKKDAYKRNGYYTTINELGMKGWELMFVTPTSVHMNVSTSKRAGCICQSYVFKKEEI